MLHIFNLFSKVFPLFAVLFQMSLELALSKEDISRRVENFARYVQSDTQHRIFSPGQSWWSLAESKGLENIIPDTVTLIEQIGITLTEMETSFGRYWKRNIEQIFPCLRSRQYFSKFLFVSPRDIVDFDESQTPSRLNIICKSTISINRGWRKLQSDIVRAIPRSLRATTTIEAPITISQTPITRRFNS
jgi:hypothetical protein